MFNKNVQQVFFLLEKFHRRRKQGGKGGGRPGPSILEVNC